MLKRTLPLLAFLVIAPTTALSAPIVRPATVALTVEIDGLYLRGPGPYYPFVSGPTASGTAGILVDSVARTLQVAAGALSLTTPFIAFETGVTSIASLTMTRLSNLSATFSIGGAGGIAGEPPCPLTGSGACVAQGGLGGSMGVTGTLNIVVIPNIIVIPVVLQDLKVGLGGPPVATSPATADAAPFTIGTGRIRIGTTTTSTIQGGTAGSTLTLVSPTFVNTLGNLIPVTTTLEISFTDGLGLPDFVLDTVPEPALLLLFGSVVAASIAVGARRG